MSLPHSSASSVLGTRKNVIHWEEDDPDNPYNWSSVRGIFRWGMLMGIQ